MFTLVETYDTIVLEYCQLISDCPTIKFPCLLQNVYFAIFQRKMAAGNFWN
jgi:hypothetical protein